MFIEALKQFLYGWIFKWIQDNLDHAKQRHEDKK